MGSRGHLEITGGIDRDTGRWRFFVEAMEADGGCVTMWDGATYDEAILAAEHLRRDGFGRIFDRVMP